MQLNLLYLLKHIVLVVDGGCEDSVHNCPGMCGYVRYKDEHGNIVEESGFCKADTNIRIIASEIIEVVGLNTKVCSGTF